MTVYQNQLPRSFLTDIRWFRLLVKSFVFELTEFYEELAELFGGFFIILYLKIGVIIIYFIQISNIKHKNSFIQIYFWIKIKARAQRGW